MTQNDYSRYYRFNTTDLINMSVRIKVAKSAKELVDVYKLRHLVYVEGEGYFKDIVGEMIVDHFELSFTVVVR